MSGPCQHYYRASLGGQSAYSIEPSSVVYGRGALRELGDHARALGLHRVGVLTDVAVRLENAPRPIDRDDLSALFQDALG